MGSVLINSGTTKQLLTNTILRVLEQHGELTCFELMYRMKFCRVTQQPTTTGKGTSGICYF